MAKTQPAGNKGLHDFLPEHEEKFPLQAKVRRSLFEEADKKRRLENRTWVEIVEAALQAYVSTSREK